MLRFSSHIIASTELEAFVLSSTTEKLILTEIEV
jgi:hypothetical protein